MKHSHQNCRSQTSVLGLTVIELVMAIVVLGIAVPPFMFFFYQSALDGITVERQAAAYFLAIERMEEIRADRDNSGYSYLIAGNYPDESPVTSDPAELDFDRAVTFNETTTGVMVVTVTVSYTNPSNSYVLEHTFCDY